MSFNVAAWPKYNYTYIDMYKVAHPRQAHAMQVKEVIEEAFTKGQLDSIAMDQSRMPGSPVLVDANYQRRRRFVAILVNGETKPMYNYSEQACIEIQAGDYFWSRISPETQKLATPIPMSKERFEKEFIHV